MSKFIKTFKFAKKFGIPFFNSQGLLRFEDLDEAKRDKVIEVMNLYHYEPKTYLTTSAELQFYTEVVLGYSASYETRRRGHARR